MYRRFSLLFAVSVIAAAAADVHIVEEIVCKVNGDIVTRGDLARDRVKIEAEVRQQDGPGPKLNEEVNNVMANALRDEIDKLLLVQKAKDLNIDVKSEVTRRLAAMQVQSKIADDDKFHDFVASQMGEPFEDYKQEMTNALLTQKVISEEISSKINIPEADKKKYYEEHKKDFVRDERVFLSQILVSTEGKTPDQVAAAERKAKDLVERARKGEKFGELAAANSDDLDTARQGGELPGYRRDQLTKAIGDIVFSQPKGYVTDPIKTPNGFLILRINERYEKGLASYEEVEEEITNRMIMPQMNSKVRTYLTSLREEAFLEIKPGYVDTAAAPGKDTSWHDVAQLKPETVTKEQAATERRHKKLLWIIPLPWTESPKKPVNNSPQPAARPASAPAPASASTPTAPSQP